MPQQQTITTWFALNGANDVSPSGMADIRTGEPIYVGGLNVGDWFDLTEQEANSLSYSDVGILHAGRYRRIGVDPAATVANVVAGKIGLLSLTLRPPTASGWGMVTTADLGTLGVRPVVFLNKIDPGKYGFIQELGIANVMIGAALAAGAPVMASATGVAVSGSTPPNYLGVLLDPVTTANTVARVQLDLPTLQD